MRTRSIIGILCFAALLAGNAIAQEAVSRELPPNYVSDRCSWFPDGDWAECCVTHDKEYFFGGTRKQRKAADKRLYQCVKAKGHSKIAAMMWIGVRIGAVGFLPTSFRWGFGSDWSKTKPAR